MHSHFKKFVSYYKPYRKQFFLVLAASFLATGFMLLFPLCTRYITKTVLEGDLTQALPQIWRTGVVMVLLILGQTLCNFYQDYKGHAMGAMMERDMREELFAQYQRMPFRFFDNNRVGTLMSRVTNDLLTLSEMYHHVPEDIVLYFVRFFGAVIILMVIHFQLTLAVLVLLPPMLVFAFYFNGKMRKATRASQERIADVNAQVEDSLSGIRVVQSFTGEKMEQEKFSRENNQFFASRKRIYLTESYLYQGVVMFTQLITTALVVFGGVSIVGARMDLADLITFLLYVAYLTEPVQHLLFTITQYQEGMAGFDRFMEIMELEPEIQDAPGALTLGRGRGEIQFSHVSFRYGKESGQVLRDITFTTKPGESIALVGISGVGKTTLCSLIPRFYDVSQGAVLFDGVDVREWTLQSLRQNIGVVQQDVYVFSSTIYENIRYGMPDATREQVIQAAKLAGIHQFIMGLPRQYDTDIGPKGVKLSGGQKQRLSIARVFLKNPPVLILDEATSALDTQSEQVIQQSLEQLSQNRTTFLIAHRLSTVRHATRILVLEEGTIAEQGTHQELMEQNGIYANMCRMQAASLLAEEAAL